MHLLCVYQFCTLEVQDEEVDDHRPPSILNANFENYMVRVNNRQPYEIHNLDSTIINFVSCAILTFNVPF